MKRDSRKLSLQEELALLKDYKLTGNIKSKRAVMEDYVEYLEGLTLSKFGNKDLMSEAYLVLDDILERNYDYTKGTRLITRAFPDILHRLNDIVNELPYSNGTIHKVKNRKKKFIATFGYEPDEEELADYCGETVGAVKSALYILERREVKLNENMDLLDEEYEESPLLTIPNGLLSTEEKMYLEKYLKGEPDKDIMKEMKITYNTCLTYYKGIVNKLKDYYKEEH